MQKIFGLEDDIEFCRVESGNVELADSNQVFRTDTKVVGLYFSASYCPPCCKFTPILIQKYMDIRARNLPIEIILIPSDKTQEAFENYFKGDGVNTVMPWFSLSFQSQIKQTLRDNYGVKTIPTLIFFNADSGEIIEREGRLLVQNNTIEDVIAKLFLNKI